MPAECLGRRTGLAEIDRHRHRVAGRHVLCLRPSPAGILSGALGVEVTAQATQGPTRNIILIETGHAALGLITMGIGWEAWNGSGDWTQGRQFRALRAILPMYDSPFQMAVVKRLGVRSLDQLAGKRIGASPRGSTSGTYFPRIFEALGISAVFANGSVEEMMSQISAGQLDGVVLATGVPVPALFELDQKEGMAFIPFTSDQIGILKQRMPELSDSVIPNGTYPSLTVEYPTIGLFNFVVAHKDLPDVSHRQGRLRQACTISPDSFCREGDHSCQYK